MEHLRRALDIASKDLLRYTRSLFIWSMMLAAPLMIAGLIYFAFSGLGGDGGFSVPATRLHVVNLDGPSDQAGSFSAGALLLEFLQNEQLSDLVKVTVGSDEFSARAAVEAQSADVVLIIPENLTEIVLGASGNATITMVQDPTLSIGPGIVKTLLEGFLDGFSGSKIAPQVVAQQLDGRGIAVSPQDLQSVALEYATWATELGRSHGEGQHPAIDVQAPPTKVARQSMLAGLAGKILAGQLIFFSFFTAASTAESIITEQEQHTLARLFTTPTARTAILGGKFIAVFLLVMGQITVLIVVSAVLFGVRWGQPLSVALVALALVVVSGGFGIFLMSFVRSTQQAGPVLGGVLTIMGMAGGLFTTGVENMPGFLDTISLLVPQGWALRAWKLSLAGATAGELWSSLAVMLAMGVASFALGAVAFRRRLAQGAT
jgi:ABC-2 type transport system permease protein